MQVTTSVELATTFTLSLPCLIFPSISPSIDSAFTTLYHLNLSTSSQRSLSMMHSDELGACTYYVTGLRFFCWKFGVISAGGQDSGAEYL